jgi:CheY-like chemotaxis protein
MKTIKILFVDDNTVNLLAAENLLLSFGISIDRAESGESAILMATKEEYDLIFMDLLMPKLDGVMTTKLLRMKLDHSFNTKIIATSGIEMIEIYNDNQDGLFDGRLQKPLKLEQLKNCLIQWLGHERLLELQRVEEKQITEEYVEEWKQFISIFRRVEVIKLDYLFNIKNKDVEYVILLMKSSRKQIAQAIMGMRNTMVSHDDKIAHGYLHSLKSVLYYLGAHSLAASAEGLDNILIGESEKKKRTQKFVENMKNYQVLIEQLEVLCSELEQALNAYNSSINNYQKAFNEATLTIEEIRKKIEQILNHITRFEYIEILNGLNHLVMLASQDLKPLIYQAIAALEEFDYERVEAILKYCWNDFIKS